MQCLRGLHSRSSQCYITFDLRIFLLIKSLFFPTKYPPNAALRHSLCCCRKKIKGVLSTHPKNSKGGIRIYLTVATFLLAAATSLEAFSTAEDASSVISLPAAIIISTVSICTFFAISVKAVTFSDANSA